MIKLYNDIWENISKINFSFLWFDFKPVNFALYNDENVCLGGKIFKKDERFIGNTSIIFNNEYIAIWNIQHSFHPDLDILTSKIVHEMFHSFQHLKNETRWANEFLGLEYDYSCNNLIMKCQENKILIDLYNNFDKNKFNEFLKLRKYRQKHYPKEFDYETKIEVIEGMANYIELAALKQLNYDKYLQSLEMMKSKITDISNLIPIRNICYSIGALLLIVCDRNNISVKHTIGDTNQTIYEILSSETPYVDIEIMNDSIIEKNILDYHQHNENLINHFTNQNLCKVKGNFKIYGFDPMNTIKWKNYLYCNHFIAYFDLEESKIIQRECVVKIDEQFNILEIYY